MSRTEEDVPLKYKLRLPRCHRGRKDKTAAAGEAMGVVVEEEEAEVVVGEEEEDVEGVEVGEEEEAEEDGEEVDGTKEDTVDTVGREGATSINRSRVSVFIYCIFVLNHMD